MQNIELQATIPDTLNGSRLDQALAQLFPQYSRSQLQQWIKQNAVTINTKPCTKPREKVTEGQIIHIDATLEDKENWAGEDIPLTILYEDKHLIVLNKPAGIVVHPGAGNPDKTLVNALLHYAPELKKLPRGGIVHRLDKDTSGVMMVARTLEAHHALVQALQAREVSREYEAIVLGVMIAGGTVNEPMGRHPRARTKMAVVKSGKHAVTHYRVMEKFRAHTHVHINLETGRTHQIRVHLSHINYPLVGDPVYGKHRGFPSTLSEPLKQALKSFKRQALHAKRLTFQHPTTGETKTFEAPTPDDMQSLLTLLREDAHDTLSHP